MWGFVYSRGSSSNHRGMVLVTPWVTSLSVGLGLALDLIDL
jgi:hypothetical protein